MKLHRIIIYILLLVQTINGLNAQISMTINTDPSKRKSISPYIYGVNSYIFDNTWGANPWKTGLSNHGNQANIEKMNITSFRIGGNATTALNWENGANNGAIDDAFKNSTFQTFIATGQGAGASPSFYAPNLAYVTTQNHALQLGARALIQLPSAGFVAADVTSTVCGTPNASPSRWKRVMNNKPSALSLNPDLSDTVVYIDECINHLINQFGNSNAANGIKFYQTDNEIGLWCLRQNGGSATGTHSVLRNNTFTTCSEVLNRTLELGKTIKRMDPNALVFSSGIWNFIEAFSLWSNYDGASFRPIDWPSYNVEPYKTNNTGQQYRYNQMTWQNAFLAQMKNWEVSEGKRIIDVLSIHYYPQASLTNTNRFHNTRSLWDSTYVEMSWLTQMGNGLTEGRGLQMIPLVQKAINDFYPGTKIAITEYDFGGRNHISGTIAQADALGIFGRYNIYLATYFGTADQYISPAFQLYRNYDGNKSTFGNLDILSTTSDNANSAIYSSLNSGNDSIMHILLINKSNVQQTAKIAITSVIAYNKLTEVYGISANDGVSNLSSKTKINAQSGSDSIQNNIIWYDMEPLSCYHLVVKSIPKKSQSSAKNILSFTLTGSMLLKSNIVGTYIYDTISVSANVNNLTPIITIPAFAKINPMSGIAQNFSSPVNYTVTAEDNTTKIYTVYVTKNGSSNSSIFSTTNNQTIYPNPSSQFLNIDLEQITHIEFMKPEGVVILKKNMNPTSSHHEIDLDLLPSGLYYLSIFKENKSIEIYKFIKQ